MGTGWVGVLLLVSTSALCQAADEDLPPAATDEAQREAKPVEVMQPSVYQELPIGPFGDGVVQYLDGTPAVDAELVAYLGHGIQYDNLPINLRETTTDDHGRFSFELSEEEPRGYIHIVARDGKGNYATGRIHRRKDEVPIARLVLREEKYYHLRVVDENDQPQAGVTVHTVHGFGPLFATETDANGEARLQAFEVNEGILARLPGKGAVHLELAPSPARDEKFAKTIELKLEKTAERVVFVHDIDGKPFAGALVEILSFGRVHEDLHSCYQVYTDEKGRAASEIPISSGGRVAIHRKGYQTAKIRFSWPDRLTGKYEAYREVILPELVTLRGEVEIDPEVQVPEGWSPMVTVQYSGRNRWTGLASGSRGIGAPGKFEIQVPVDSYLMLSASQAKLTSDHVFRTVYRGKSPEAIRLRISPPVTIRGQVLVAHTEQPTSGRTVNVTKIGTDLKQQMESYFQSHPLRETDSIPDRWLHREDKVIRCDEQGKFELQTSAGRYRLQDSNSKEAIELTIQPGETADVVVWKDWGVK